MSAITISRLVPELPYGRRLYYSSVDSELGDVCVRQRGGELRAHGAHPWRHSLRYELRSVRCQHASRHFTTTSRRLLGNSGSSRFVQNFLPRFAIHFNSCSKSLNSLFWVFFFFLHNYTKHKLNILMYVHMFNQSLVLMSSLFCYLFRLTAREHKYVGV